MRSTGTSTAARTAARSSRLPPKRRCSVSTLITLAPPGCVVARPARPGRRSSASAPLLGLERLTSAMTLTPSRCSAATASGRRSRRSARAFSSSSETCAWRTARSSRTPARMSSRTLGTPQGYPRTVVLRPAARSPPPTDCRPRAGPVSGGRLQPASGREQAQRAEGGEPDGPDQREPDRVVDQRCRAPRSRAATHASHQSDSPARDSTTHALDARAAARSPWARSLTARRPPQPGQGRPVSRGTGRPSRAGTWGSRRSADRPPEPVPPTPPRRSAGARRSSAAVATAASRSAQRTAVVPRGSRAGLAEAGHARTLPATTPTAIARADDRQASSGHDGQRHQEGGDEEDRDGGPCRRAVAVTVLCHGALLDVCDGLIVSAAGARRIGIRDRAARSGTAVAGPRSVSGPRRGPARPTPPRRAAGAAGSSPRPTRSGVGDPRRRRDRRRRAERDAPAGAGHRQAAPTTATHGHAVSTRAGDPTTPVAAASRRVAGGRCPSRRAGHGRAVRAPTTRPGHGRDPGPRRATPEHPAGGGQHHAAGAADQRPAATATDERRAARRGDLRSGPGRPLTAPSTGSSDRPADPGSRPATSSTPARRRASSRAARACGQPAPSRRPQRRRRSPPRAAPPPPCCGTPRPRAAGTESATIPAAGLHVGHARRAITAVRIAIAMSRSPAKSR